MANLCAIAVHCTRGSEIILERRTHSVAHEVTGASSLLGAAFWPVDIAEGRITPGRAARVYGVVTGADGKLDRAATARLRAD